MRTVVITGVSSGIGEALAKRFLQAGDRVIGTVLTGEAEASDALHLFRLDLSSPDSIETCAKEIAKEVQAIDIFINNAGVLLDEKETTVVPELLRRTLEVDLIGPVDFTERLLHLVKPGGHIINISSTAGSLALVDSDSSHFPGHYPSYKIAKSGVNMYTRTLALRLKDDDICVSSVHPGWVRTKMGGEAADLSPEEAAEGIYQFAITHSQTGGFWFQGKSLPW